MSVILKMDDSLHSKNTKRGRFKVAKFLNKIKKFIHQMCDKMVMMIVIGKDTRMETISKVVQIDVEGSFMIKPPPPPPRGGDYGGYIKEKRQLTTFL
jgi:hypothetical protein